MIVWIIGSEGKLKTQNSNCKIPRCRKVVRDWQGRLFFAGLAAEAGVDFAEPGEDGLLIDVIVEAVAVAAAVDEAGFGEDLQMVGDGGLTEAELIGEFNDVVHFGADFLAGEELHDAEAGGFAEGSKGAGEAVVGGDGAGGARLAGRGGPGRA